MKPVLHYRIVTIVFWGRVYLKEWELFFAECKNSRNTFKFPTVREANEYSGNRLKVLDSVHTVDSGVLLLLLLRTLQLRRRGVIPRFSPLSIESTTVNRHQRYHDIKTVILTTNLSTYLCILNYSITPILVSGSSEVVASYWSICQNLYLMLMKYIIMLYQ